MVNFQLNDDQAGLSNGKAQKNKGLKGMLISWGLAKDEKQADIYLVVILVIVVSLIIYINFF